jgi:hypothetical protein
MPDTTSGRRRRRISPSDRFGRALRWLRWPVVAIWLLAVVALNPLASGLSNVTNSGVEAYLPSTADSTKVVELEQAAQHRARRGEGAATATVTKGLLTSSPTSAEQDQRMPHADNCRQWRDLERQAWADAEQHLPDGTGLQHIRAALDKVRTDLGSDDARAHAIQFRPNACARIAWGAPSWLAASTNQAGDCQWVVVLVSRGWPYGGSQGAAKGGAGAAAAGAVCGRVGRRACARAGQADLCFG